MIAGRAAHEEKERGQMLLSEAVEKFSAARQLVNSAQKTLDNLKPDCNEFVNFIDDRNRKLLEASKVFYVTQVTARRASQ